MIPAEDFVVGDRRAARGRRSRFRRRSLARDLVNGVDESLLTGKSLPVEKDARAVSDVHAAVVDRPSMAFSATIVSRGVGRGVVVATGSATELGVIAESLRARQPSTRFRSNSLISPDGWESPR